MNYHTPKQCDDCKHNLHGFCVIGRRSTEEFARLETRYGGCGPNAVKKNLDAEPQPPRSQPAYREPYTWR